MSTLAEDHSLEAIQARISSSSSVGYLKDFILGAVDGTITTFAIVAGVAGAGFDAGAEVALVLGVANVVADGFSMGVSNYLAVRSDIQMVNKVRSIEEHHIEHFPEGEKEEIREIFRQKGFSDELVEDITTIVTSNRDLWIDTMLRDEWGLNVSNDSPFLSGGTTFLAFLTAGMVPLLPLISALFTPTTSDDLFIASAVLAGGCFIFIGYFKGRVTDTSPLRGAFETLLIGGFAAWLAYFAGDILAEIIH